MRAIAWNTKLLVALCLAGGVPLACGGGGSTSTNSAGSGSGSGGNGGAVTSSGGDGGAGLFANSSGTGSGALTVVPPSATIDVVNGVAMPVDFDAEIDGQKVSASWIVDLSSIAGIDANGVVTATGNQGGDVVVKATVGGETATAQVKVNIKKLVNPGNIDVGVQTSLQQASTPDPSIVWAYPYNGTVFPKGLLAPEMMWNGSTTGDLYYVHLTGKFIDFEVFTTADPPSRFALDDTSWKQLTESGQGGPVHLHVARLGFGAPAPTVIVDHDWTIANGSLRGTVYYWANSIGRVLRIKPGAAAPEDFLAAGGQTGCSTCHAVSANGSTLIIGGDIAVSTWDLLTNTAVLNIQSVGKPVRNWSMPAISPSGKVLVENNAALPGPPGGSDALWDTTTGQKLVGLGLDGVLLDMPAFAPNGTKLAYVDHNTKALGVRDFDANTNMVTNPVELVPQGGSTIAFPSVSPDAKWIVYHRGALDTRGGAGDLYLASIDQPGLEIRLGATNGDGYPFAAGGRDLSYNFEPTFAPLNSGGFAWVVFTTRRTYGNRLTGPAFAGDGVGVKQIWVAAIDQNPQPGADPSHPAFWVPGQDLNTLNMRGFWALDPCKQVGDSCTTGSECCNQNCDQGVCKDPDPNECSQDGNHCEQSSDCCNPAATCINNICSEPPPQ
jgi:hypothetical protein